MALIEFGSTYQFPFYGLPKTEWDVANHLIGALDRLYSYAKNFEMGLLLFEDCQAQLAAVQLARQRWRTKWEEVGKLYGEDREREAQIEYGNNRGPLDESDKRSVAWMMIAARDAALQIYHIGAGMIAIRQSMCLSPSLNAIVSAQELRIAYRAFHQHFPKYEDIRHAIAHDAEFYIPPGQAVRNQGLVQSGYFRGVHLRGISLANDWVVTSTEGTVNQFQIARPTLALIRDGIERFVEPFRAAARHIEETVCPIY